MRRLVVLTAALASLLASAGCGGSGSSGPAPAPAPTIAPGPADVVPTGTSGGNVEAVTPAGVRLRGAVIIGEPFPIESVTATAPDGTVLGLRHGFFPGTQPSTVIGPG